MQTPLGRRTLSRRTILSGIGLGAAGLLAGCTSGDHSMPGGATAGSPSTSGATSADMGVHDLGRAFAPPTPLEPTPGQRVVAATLTPAPATVDLGGVRAATWAYGSVVPGPVIRATAGDLVRITVDNRLPAPTTVHWHGIRLRNEADGVPGLTQAPIAPGAA